MNIIECTDERLALHLNPFQLFVIINEKTRPYLNVIRQMESKYQEFHFEYIDFEAADTMQFKVSDKIDPQLYFSIMHADLVARLMPAQWGRKCSDYTYLVHTFTSSPSTDIVQECVRGMVSTMSRHLEKGVYGLFKRFFFYGDDDFDAFFQTMSEESAVRLSELEQKLSSRYIPSNVGLTAVEKASKDFVSLLTSEEQEDFWRLVKDDLGYYDEEESRLVFESFLHYKYTDEGGYYDFFPNHDSGSINDPNFCIAIVPSANKRISKANYDIIIAKDNQAQESTVLNFYNEKGSKMLFVLILLLYKKGDGFSNILFNNEEAGNLIIELYNLFFEAGGKEWLNGMRDVPHRISMYRNHASSYVTKDNPIDDNTTKYWCSVENVKKKMGRKKETVRLIHLPQDRILIESDEIKSLMDRFPSLDDLVKNPFKKIKENEILAKFRDMEFGNRRKRSSYNME